MGVATGQHFGLGGEGQGGDLHPGAPADPRGGVGLRAQDAVGEGQPISSASIKLGEPPPPK